MRALLSVYDKAGLTDLAQGLAGLGWELIASGKTAAALTDAGIPVTEVAQVTGAPEMLGGRVKTLHPKVHGGILADRSNPSHLADLEAQQVAPIDLVVCNLYPFSSDPSVELIDIGGPTMVRAAAKNHASVGVVVDPSDYPGVLEELRAAGSLSSDTRRRLARAAFAHSAAYDAAIVEWFDAGGAGGEPELLPPTLHLALERAVELRYGENPHQRGARYRAAGRPTWWDGVVQHGGSALSYLNLFDADAAWRLVAELGTGPEVAVAIIKHANPCGAALGATLADAYRRALECDPVSAFGGVVALGGPCTVEVAQAVAEGPNADVIVAPSFEAGAVDALVARRKVTRLLEAPPYRAGALELRSLGVASSSRTPTIWPRRARTGRCPPRWPPPTPSGATSSWPGGCAPGRRPTPSSSPLGARPSGWERANRAGSKRPRSRRPRPGPAPGAGRPPATPSSPSATGSTCWPRRAWRRSCRPGDRSTTARWWPPPTSTASPWSSPVSATSGTEEVPVTARILDGEALAARFRAEITDRVARLAAEGIRPGLGTILVGDDTPSERYVALKHADCAEVGIASVHEHLPAETSQEELEAVIRRFNADPAVHAYLVQLPLPKGLDEEAALLAVDDAKDVDGLHPVNLGRLVMGTPGPLPCTPAGIVELLHAYDVPVEGRHVVVIGRGITIGRPLALLLALKRPGCNAAVTVVHTGVADLAHYVRQADIVVAAAGSAGLVTPAMVKPGAAVVGAGTTWEGRKVLSDVEESVAEVAGWITPRIGGVGPMTRAMLLRNAVRAAERSA